MAWFEAYMLDKPNLLSLVDADTALREALSAAGLSATHATAPEVSTAVPATAHRFLTRLASFARLILLDKRGTGLSDPVAELPTLEQRMDDVRAVMDAVGSQRAALLGVSEGGPMCALFAATYPEKAEALVMIGSYAKRVRSDDYPWGTTREERDAFGEAHQPLAAAHRLGLRRRPVRDPEFEVRGQVHGDLRAGCVLDHVRQRFGGHPVHGPRDDAVDGEALFLPEAFLDGHRVGQRVDEDAVLADRQALGHGGRGTGGEQHEARGSGAEPKAHSLLPISACFLRVARPIHAARADRKT